VLRERALNSGRQCKPSAKPAGSVVNIIVPSELDDARLTRSEINCRYQDDRILGAIARERRNRRVHRKRSSPQPWNGKSALESNDSVTGGCVTSRSPHGWPKLTVACTPADICQRTGAYANCSQRVRYRCFRRRRQSPRDDPLTWWARSCSRGAFTTNAEAAAPSLCFGCWLAGPSGHSSSVMSSTSAAHALCHIIISADIYY
jgi:hypothetical protein